MTKLPDKEELARLKKAGFTYKQIGAQYDVTENGVKKAMKRHGLSEELAWHKDHIPWKVQERHTKSQVYQNLLTWSKIEQAFEVTEANAHSFNLFRIKLRLLNAVVDYDPDYDGTEISRSGGWKLVPRESDDGDSLIRTPDTGGRKDGG